MLKKEVYLLDTRLKLVGWLMLPFLLALWPIWYCMTQQSYACKSNQNETTNRDDRTGSRNIRPYAPVALTGEYSKQTKYETPEGGFTDECSFPCRIVYKTSYDAVALFTAFLVYFVYVQIIWIARQEWWARIHERAYVFGYPRRLKIYKTGKDAPTKDGKIPMVFTVHNYGKTPGFVKETVWKFCPIDEKLPEQPIYEGGQRRSESTYIVLESIREWQTKNIFDYLQSWGKKQQKVYGRVIYEDVFRVQRESRFILSITVHKDGRIEHEPIDDAPKAYTEWI